MITLKAMFGFEDETPYVEIGEIIQFPNKRAVNLMNRITCRPDFNRRKKSEFDKLFGKPIHQGKFRNPLYHEFPTQDQELGYKTDCYYQGKNFIASPPGRDASLISFYFKLGTSQEEAFATLEEINSKLQD